MIKHLISFWAFGCLMKSVDKSNLGKSRVNEKEKVGQEFEAKRELRVVG